MGRFALIVMGVVAWIALANGGYSLPASLDDKLWLVALFPGVYVLGLTLLGE